jgi:hypothetical protein
MQSLVPLSELDERMKRFRVLMDARHPDWEIALIISKINLYYFTGTIQDGILLIYGLVRPASGCDGVTNGQWMNHSSRTSSLCGATGMLRRL